MNRPVRDLLADRVPLTLRTIGLGLVSARARQLLEADGFRLRDGSLRDVAGRAVAFSLITNAGHKARERMAPMFQQDLTAIGIKLNVVTVDFPSRLDRITRSFSYECCLLGMVNLDLEPNSQMNVWLSSGTSHRGYPGQKSPQMPWKAEIDRLTRKQASSLDPKVRKAAFDQVQQIAFGQCRATGEVFENPVHAHTQRLIEALPELPGRRLPTVKT